MWPETALLGQIDRTAQQLGELAFDADQIKQRQTAIFIERGKQIDINSRS